jgi:hypothetical protein
MNWVRFGSGLGQMKYYPDILLEGLRKSTEAPIQDKQYPGCRSNRVPPNTGVNCYRCANRLAKDVMFLFLLQELRAPTRRHHKKQQW